MESLNRPYDFAKASFYPLSDFNYCLKLAGWFFLFSILIAVPVFVSGLFGITLFYGLGWIILIFLGLLYWASYASYISAFHRRAMKGENGGLFPLRFGRTEFHVMMVQFVWLLAVIMLYIVVSLGFGIFRLIGMGIASAGGALGLIGGALIVLSIFGTLLTLAYALGRICTVTPMTVYIGQFTFSDSTKATESRGWWIVLSYVVIGLIYMVIYFVSFALILPFFGGAPLDANFSGGPISIAISLVSSFVLTLVMQMFSGVGSYLTKAYYGKSDLEKIASLYD